ncbi:MAG: phosphoribosylanthranilate isomerase [Planctomycetota bacterium]
MTTPEELALAATAGARAVGLVGPMPSGPGVLDDAAVGALARVTPPGCPPILLTSRPSAAAIAAQVRAAGVPAVQVCRPLPPAEVVALRRLLPPPLRVVHVVFVDGPQALDRARALAPHADGILLDSGAPQAETPLLGGTGRVHDWGLSAEIRAAVDVPVFLAGGLRPENVEAAVRAVRPAWVDVCSGLRPQGGLDPARLTAFVRAVAAGVR